MVNSPSFYDPITNPDNAKNRRDQVLNAMYTQGKINQADYEAAVATPVETKVTPARQGCAYASTAPYFCDYVLHLLLNDPAYGADATERERKIFRGGLTITTTLDPNAQNAAQAQVDAAAGANPDKWGACGRFGPTEHRQDHQHGPEHGVVLLPTASSTGRTELQRGHPTTRTATTSTASAVRSPVPP